jgi:hypothetical protein
LVCSSCINRHVGHHHRHPCAAHCRVESQGPSHHGRLAATHNINCQCHTDSDCTHCVIGNAFDDKMQPVEQPVRVCAMRGGDVMIYKQVSFVISPRESTSLLFRLSSAPGYASTCAREAPGGVMPRNEPSPAAIRLCSAVLEEDTAQDSITLGSLLSHRSRPAAARSPSRVFFSGKASGKEGFPPLQA